MDTEIRGCCENANYAAATQLLLLHYGDDVRAFLKARTGDQAAMEEAYSVFSEDAWRGLPSFRFEGAVRSWVFAVARNALSRYMRSNKRWGSHHVPLEPDEHPCLPPGPGDSQRTVLSRLSLLIAQLPLADRRLLRQRLTLSMRWNDIAIEHLQTQELEDEACLSRTSARLRKRYQLLIRDLRKQLALDKLVEAP